ncbi:hypothetical protein ED733_002412 [Metarhizium rileyi]|uniref:Uncharacterized protein n=1 Tax=Metarhizium rileyi (strain RCEF 4871) TaxID=1649241 RepID=A0A5C6GCI8_METRR|nr:hypothetical protein ED733_002412 [Metarhizium rileyi]
MKLQSTLVSVLLGLGAAAPQSNLARGDDLAKNLEEQMKKTREGLEQGQQAAHRDASIDRVRAIAFCSDAVLCDGYNQGGTREIISKGFRYDPLRAFWCKSNYEQMGLLTNNRIGKSLHENLYLLDFQDFRNAMEQSCKELLKGEVENQCPSRDEIDTANNEFLPIDYCNPGKSSISHQLDPEAPVEQ